MFLKPRATLLALWFISTVNAKAKSGNSSYHAVSSYQLSVRHLHILVAFHPDQKYLTIPIGPRQSRTFKRYSHDIVYKSLLLTHTLRTGKCPPCFNCMLPAFTCGQYGECDPYNGQCNCPPGWGGIDCLTPRKCPYPGVLRNLGLMYAQNVTPWRMEVSGTYVKEERNANARRVGLE